jgi:hypothetical protein
MDPALWTLEEATRPLPSVLENGNQGSVEIWGLGRLICHVNQSDLF